MQHRLKQLFLWLSFVAPIFFMNPALVQAQKSDLDLSIKPTVTYLTVEPGQKKTFQLTIAHNGTTPLTVIPQVVEFTPHSETGTPQLDLETTVGFVTVQNEVALPITSFKLLPHTQQQLTVTVNPPLDIIQKEYHLSVLLKADAANQPNLNLKNNSITSAIVASNLIALISSENIGGGPLTISQIQTNSIFDSLKPLKFKVQAKNEGLKAAPIKGRVRVLNWTNQEVASFSLAPTMILGESSRNLEYSVNGSTSDEFSYDQPFIIGPFTLEASLESASEPANTIIIKKRVLALPISIISLFLIAGLIYLTVIYFRQHRSLLPSLKKSFNLNNKT